ncbi:hypothetical protein JW926_05450 [Candidatus Sumerlaeota bacterium]|nr:hypothetical protein [Candidatus Sumerlaeota bacterium]
MSSEMRSINDMRSRNSVLRIVGKNALRILFFLLLAVPAFWIQNRRLNEVRTKPKLYRDSLYLPSGKSIKMISIGYDRFVSDFIWLRSIQAFGGHWETDRNYAPIYHLFDVITDLDPTFIDAYTFGNLVMGDEGGDQRLGLQLINKGMWKNPTKYKLPYWGGYVAYWQMNDPELAKFYYSRAVKCPDSPGFVSRIIAYMDLKSGRYQVAFEKLLQDWLMAIDNNDDVVEGIVRRRIPDILSEWNVFILNQAVKNYIGSTGNVPESLKDLEKSGSLEAYPLIDLSVMDAIIEQQKTIPGKMIDRLPRIMEASTRKNYKSIPFHPMGYWYQLRSDIKPWDTDFVEDGKIFMDNFLRNLAGLRMRIFQFHIQNNRFPYSLGEVFRGETWDAEDSFGGKWDYISPLGGFYSSTLPVF